MADSDNGLQGLQEVVAACRLFTRRWAHGTTCWGISVRLGVFVSIYVVAKMRRDKVIWSREIEAPDPFAAASKMNGDKVSLELKWDGHWIHVTDEISGEEFAFSFET